MSNRSTQTILKCMALLYGIGFISSSIANGLGEDASWQFDDSNRKFLQLNEELARVKIKEGGFKQVFNVQADGASTVYVGNTTNVGDVDQINNNTAVGNMNTVTITGNENVVGTNQLNQNSDQSALGTDINVTSNGNNVVGIPVGTINSNNQ